MKKISSSLPLLHTERGRELVTGSSVGGTFCLETINTQQVMPWDRDRMSRMIALEMFAVNTVPFITFLSKFGKTNNQTKPGHLCCAVLASWRLTLAVDLILKIFNDPLFCTSVRLHFLPLHLVQSVIFSSWQITAVLSWWLVNIAG